MADISGSSALKPNQRYTLKDRAGWPEDERWELIDGVPFDMSPSPRVAHQKAAGNLYLKLCLFLEGKPCQPLISPVDVFLDVGKEKETVVMPDVLVVCDPDKIKDDGIHGAPDFVAEILSSSTAYRDLGEKKHAYAQAGVREYWVIHPSSRAVTVFVLAGKDYAPGQEYPAGHEVESKVLAGFRWFCP